MSKHIYRICPICSTSFRIKDEYLYDVFNCPFCSSPLIIKGEKAVVHGSTEISTPDPKEIM